MSSSPTTLARPRRWPALLAYVLGFLVLMVAYEAIRDVVAPAADATEPYTHADQVIRMERAVGLFVEPDLQRGVHAIPGGNWLTTWFYTVAYTAGYVLFLGWVFFARRTRMRFMFTWYWLTNALALVSYGLYPLAPPRFITGLAMADPTKSALEVGGSLSWFQQFRNLYAAMPSMHVGQALLYAIAVGAMVRSKWRHLAWIWPAFMLLTVMATANHYWLDGVGGLVCVVIALGLTRLVTRGERLNQRDEVA